MSIKVTKLENRGVIRLSGSETVEFLQGLVTNDVALAKGNTAVYAGLLTAQGKFLFDMIIVRDGDDLLLDVEAERKPDLIRRLMMYKLRAAVDIVDEAALSIWAASGDEAPGGITVTDPRHPRLGWRHIGANTPNGDAWPYEDYEALRISLGVPDGSRDMAVEKNFWLETGAERLNGVSFTKGCFVGQELTARMKHRTNVKKMLVPLNTTGSKAATGSKIMTPEGKTVGDIRSVAGNHAIAYFRLEHNNAQLTVDGQPVALIGTRAAP